jgi:hypothetical protein
MGSNRDIAGLRLLLGTLVALCALAALVARPAAAADAAEDPGCPAPQSWKCDNSASAVPGGFIVFFNDWVEEDPGEIAREHIALYGGVLGFVYPDLNGYSVSELTDAGAEGISADPRVMYMGRDHYVCMAADGDLCAEEPDPPPPLPVDVPSLPKEEAAVVGTPAASVAHPRRNGKRCRRRAKKAGNRCGRRAGRSRTVTRAG